MTEQRQPPIIQLGVASMVLIVAAGITLVSHLPNAVPLAVPWILLAASAAALVANAFLLTRIEGFAWARFTTVAKWTLAAYTVTAGMLEYTFIRNHTSGGPLVVLTLSLVVYAINVPVLVAYTVAHYVPED